MLLTINNDGPDIADTNYWQTEHAGRGLVYVSGNAGVLRLLVPRAAEHMLAEMRTGSHVTIEPSIQAANCYDLVFEDGSTSPFAIAVDKRQFDRRLDKGQTPLAIWTEDGKQIVFDALVK